MRYIRGLIVVVFLGLLSDFVMANGIIRGRVADKDNHGISHVNVIVNKGKVYAITNADGKYSIEMAPGEYELTFTHIQYKGLTKKIILTEGQTVELSVSLEEAVFNMDEVTVTGSSVQMELKKLPSSISIIKTSDPEFKAVTTIDDALSRIPGVYVDRMRGLTTTGSHTQVSLRGTGAANRTLVMKDGIPLNSAYTGGISQWNTLATNSISRIEVVKGAASSLYGNNAMGGVINMVTQSPSEKPVLEAGVEYGSMNTTLVNLKAGKFFKSGLGIMVFSEYKQTDGYKYMHDTLWPGYYNKPNSKLLNVTAKVNYHVGNSGLLEFVGDIHQEKNLTGTTTTYDANNINGNFLLRYKIYTGKINAELTAYTNRSKNQTDAVKWNSATEAFDNDYYTTNVPYSENGFMAKASHSFGFNNVTIGTDFRLYDMESEYDYYEDGVSKYGGQQVFYSAFFNDEMSLTKKIDVSLGLRYDYWKNQKGTFNDNTSGEEIAFDYPVKTANALSPKLGLVYRPVDAIRLRTSFSTGFKAPSMYYLYRSAPHGTTTFDLGNPDLKPERMVYSYEAGGDFYLNNKLEISATWYISEFKDFLDKVNVDSSEVPSYFSPGEGVVVRQSVNIGRVRLQGFEASLRYKMNRYFTGVAAYTYSQSEILKYEVDEELEGNELEDSPKHIANIGLLFDHSKLFSLGIWYKYTGKRYSDMENTAENEVDGYGLVNLDISRSFLKNRLTFSFLVNNLFDKEYYGYYGSAKSYYYGAPRSFMGGVTYKF